MLLGLGCAPDTFLSAPEPPDTIRFLAAVARDPRTGAPVGGSRIVERGARWKLDLQSGELDADGLAVELLGWSEPLSPPHLGADTDLGPIRAANGCETPLPTPTWRAQLRNEAPEPDTELTTPVLARTCPLLAAPGALEPVHLCGRNYCGQTVRQDGCAVEFGTAGCGFERTAVRGHVNAYGKLCFPAAEGCREEEALASVFRRLRCEFPDVCTIDWVKPRDGLPPLRVSRRDLVETEPNPVQALLAQPSEASNGPLQELLVSEAGLWILARGYDRLTFGHGASSSRLLRLDPETLALQGEWALPDGVGALAWAKDRATIIGVRLDPIAEVYALLRLSLEGAVLEEHPLRSASPQESSVASIFREVPEHELYLLIVDASSDWAQLITFERESLAPKTLCWPDFSVKASDVLMRSSDELWLSENEDDYLPLVSLSRCERLGAMTMDTPGNFGMGYFLRRPGSDRVLLTLGGLSSNGVSAAPLEPGRPFPARGASFYESFMVPTRLAASPYPGLALAAVHSSRGTETARIAWFDLDAELFLPGAVEIGPGMVARIETLGDGVFYLLMGRSGGVVRVDTR